MNWETLRADEYCIAVKDGTHDTPKPVDFGYKLVTGKHVKNGQIDSSSAYYISEEDYNAINKRSMVERWDVIMSMIGTVGEAAVVKNDPDYAIKNVALFKCGGSEVCGKWLCYYLNSPEGKGKMLGEMKGSSQQFLSLKQLRELPIMFSEEKVPRIVEIISNYDDLIENNQKQIKLLEDAAQRLYKEWFVNLRFPGHENTKIVDGVPEGWKKNCAEKFFEITIGKTPPRTEKRCFTTGKNGIPWVSIADMGNSGMFVLNTAENLTDDAIKQYNVKVIPKNAVLLSFKLTVGRVAIAPNDICTNEAIAHFKGRRECEREYTYFYLKNFHYDELGSTSSISKAVNSKIIKAMPFIMPSEKLLKEYSSKTKDAFDLIICKQKMDNNLKIARDRILHKLMSGEVEV